MNKSVPVRVVLLILLLGALFTVGFGWMVRSTTLGSDRSGKLGEAAVVVASFPTVTKQVLDELLGHATGDIQDRANRTERPPHADYSEFAPVTTVADIDLPGLLIKADPARLAKGWRLLAGAFAVNGEFENAALLLSPGLKVVRLWILDEVPIEGAEAPRPKYRKFVHGIEILPDGSLIFTFDGSMSLQRFDACGLRQWATAGRFHHAVTLDGTGETVWTFNADAAAQVSVHDGEVLRQIELEDVIAANPMIDILEIRRKHDNALGTNARNTDGEWMPDPLHFNDVDPLPAALASDFDGFAPGDLLLSSRALNLVYVVDPDSLKRLIPLNPLAQHLV